MSKEEQVTHYLRNIWLSLLLYVAKKLPDDVYCKTGGAS